MENSGRCLKLSPLASVFCSWELRPRAGERGDRGLAAAWLEDDGRRPGSLTSRQTRVVFKKVELVFWERNALTSPHLGGPQRQDRAVGKQLPACSEEGLFTVSWSRREGVAGGGDLTRPPPKCVCAALGLPWPEPVDLGLPGSSPALPTVFQ